MLPPACCPLEIRYAPSHPVASHPQVHTGEKPYRCQLCPYRTHIIGNLKKHNRVHARRGDVAIDGAAAPPGPPSSPGINASGSGASGVEEAPVTAPLPSLVPPPLASASASASAAPATADSEDAGESAAPGTPV